MAAVPAGNGATGFIAQAGQALGGWSMGFRFAIENGQEGEIRQGGNHTLAAFPQAGQAGSVCMLVDQLAKFIPNPIAQTVVKVLTNVVPLLAFPFTIFCGVTADRVSYPLFAAFVNRTTWNGFLPATIQDMSPWVVDVIDFTAKHLGDIMQVAMIVGGVALMALGSYVMGTFILGALAYQVLDARLGVIPRKVSLFIETYMPIVSWVGVLIIGNPVLQAMATVALIMYIPGVFPFLMEKLDQGVCKIAEKFGAPMPGAPLTEIHAPLVEHKEPTFAEIQAILAGGDADFEINPAHCSKSVLDMSRLPKDRDYGKLLTMFHTVDWTQRYLQVRLKLKDDDRFLDFLSERFPTVDRETLKGNFEHFIGLIADAEGVSKEQFLANWIETQLKDGLITALKGKRRIAGRQADLADAIESVAMLIPHLEGLGPQNRVTFEDTLLALAVEGGFYCGRGVKRIASELSRLLLYPTLGAHARDTGNPDTNYELQVRQALQDRRSEIVEAKYDWLTRQMLHLPERIRGDIHGMDMYRLFLSLGFTPLTPNEHDSLSTMHYLIWEMYHHKEDFQIGMLREYQEGLDEVLHTQGEAQFANYMRRMINANKSLTTEQKEELVERLAGTHEDYDYMDPHAWHRLMLLGLGVLRPKAGSRASRARTAGRSAARDARALSTAPRGGDALVARQLVPARV